MDKSKFVTLISQDKIKTNVDINLFRNTYQKEYVCMLIYNMIETYIDEPDEIENEFDLLLVKNKYVKLFIEFLQLYDIHPLGIIDQPLSSSNLNENKVPQELATFINKLTIKEVQDLLEAAEYLICQPLIELCSAKIAAAIRGKSPEKIKEILGIKEEETSADET